MRYAAEDGLLRGRSRTDRGWRSRVLNRPWRLAAVLAAIVLLPIGLAIASVSTAPSGQRDWYWQNPLPQGNTLNAVAVDGSTDAWAVGGPGIVLRTRDRGRVWEAQDPHTDRTLNAVDLVGTSGWTVGDGGTIRATGDDGSTWTTQTAGVASDLRGIAMADASTGWIAGDDGTILGTTDGGADWNVLTSGTTARLDAVATVGDGRVWVVGDGGIVLHSADGGASWAQHTVPGAARLNGVSFLDSSTGWVVGDAVGGVSAVYKTTDGGVTWTAQTIDGGKDLLAVTFVNSSTGWAVGAGGTIAYTTDGGTTWSGQGSGVLGLRGAAAWGPADAVAVGVSGRMLRTADAGATWTGPGAPTVASLGGLAFRDALSGIAVGAGGTIAITEDGGAAWQALGVPLTTDLHAADAAGGAFWIAGDGGAILRSTDGTNWAEQTSGSTAALRGIDAVDVDHAWAVGDGATILNTTDGGATPWTAQASGVATSVDFNGASFPDDQYGWVVGGSAGASATVAHTTDGGSTWTTQPVDAGDAILHAASFVDRNNGWVVGDGGLVKHTADGGSTWTTQDAGTGAPLFAVRFTDAQNGWVAGGVGGGVAEVKHTADGGTTWTNVPPGTGNVIRALAFVDAQRGWAAGDGGTILRTTDPGAPSTAITVTPTPPDGQNGWYVTTPTVELTPSKPGITYFRVDGGPLSTFSAPFSVASDGTHTVEYYTVDTADTRETTRGAELHIDMTPPSAPTGLAAAATSSTIAAVSWEPAVDTASGVAHYRVTLDGAVLGDVTGTAATITDLSAEGTYVIGVRAIDVAGNASGESTTSIQTNATLPRPPSAVYARLAARNQVYVDWNEPTATVGPVSYGVWRSVDGGPYQRVGGTTGVLSRSFVDTTAPDPVTLAYGVVVTDSRGTGSLSAAGSIFDSVLTSGPPPPVRLRALATTQGIETSWTAPATASPVTFALLRSTSPTSAPTTITPAGLSATNWRDTGVAPHTEYWYRAVSVDASGEAGPLSEPVYVRAETIGPPGPHANFKKVDDPCALCHAAHTGLQENLLRVPGDSELPLCYSCHDGTSASDVLGEFSDPDRLARHDVTAGPMPGGLTCAACHDPHGAGGVEATGSLLYVQGARSGNAVCYGCHTATSTPVPFGDLRMFERSGHSTGVPDPSDDSKVKCLACHAGHSDRMDAMTLFSADDRCIRCHSVDGSYPGAADIKGALAGPGPDTRHDLLASDQAATGARIACNNCHEPHSSSLATPLVDPRGPSTTGGWAGTSTDFCLRCHGVALPTSAETTPWVSPPLAPGGAAAASNVASSWPTSFHGGGASLAANLRVDVGWTSGDKLTCLDCHDAHGSLNRWALRTSIPSRAGSPTVDGLLVTPVGNGADFRFVCSGCHDLTPANHPGPGAGGADLGTFPIDCTASGCHTHAGAGL